MKTLTNLISPFFKNTLHTDTYEIVENEVLTAQNYKDLTVSGSLFSLTLFKNVTFDSCAFYATKFINCEFVGCKFANCTFQFSHISETDFHSCTFEDNLWTVSSISKSYLSSCFVDLKTSYHLMKEDNVARDCFTSKTPTWEDVDASVTETISYEDETLIKKAS